MIQLSLFPDEIPHGTENPNITVKPTIKEDNVDYDISKVEQLFYDCQSLRNFSIDLEKVIACDFDIDNNLIIFYNELFNKLSIRCRSIDMFDDITEHLSDKFIFHLKRAEYSFEPKINNN